MKFLIVSTLLTHILFSQEFSTLAATEDTYLNFQKEHHHDASIFIDEASLLAWQNSIALISFQKKRDAQNYCKYLKLGGFSWSIPTSYELKTLSYTQISFGKKERYFISNTPVWDNTLAYGYDVQKGHNIAFKKDTKELYIRCVSRLEE